MRIGYASLRYAVKRLAVLLPLLVIAQAAPAAAEPLRLVVLGDSLAAGYGLAETDSFTVRLQQALEEAGEEVVVHNAGVSGDTTAGGLARLDWAFADGADAALVELGANDMLRGIDPASSRANLDAILARLGERGIPVLLAGMRAPQNLGADYVAAFEGMYPELAQAHGALLYPFFLEGVAGEAGLNQEDGMHPSADGVDVIVAAILPDVLALLERARAGS